jgi:hypothetical protein
MPSVRASIGGTVMGRDADTVQLSLDAAVALARDTFQPLAIEDGDVPTVIADESRGLEYPG